MKKRHYDKEDRNKHLEFIQNTINRMATNSFILKGWSVTLVTGIIALSLTNTKINFIYLAFIPTLAFWGLDSYYLRQERLFRKLYDYVRTKDVDKIEPFSLNTNLMRQEVKNWFSTCFSFNLMSLHLTIIIILLLIVKFGGK